MKLRIKDSAVRLRLTLKELEQLKRDRALENETRIPSGDGASSIFRYALRIVPELPASRLRAEPFALIAELNAADFDELCDDAQEGVYVRREYTDAAGMPQRFMFFVEKDRPGSTCQKPEEWIYEERLGMRPETRPIPKKS